MRLRRVVAVIAKESKEIARDPITVWIALLMPLVMLFIFGYAISLDVEDVTLGILDQDQRARAGRSPRTSGRAMLSAGRRPSRARARSRLPCSGARSGSRS
jgi:hypothetical protein